MSRLTGHACIPPRGRAWGVGLVELLISLSIVAALLTATAVATDASFKAYAVNQQQAALMQRARLTMHRILTDIRMQGDHRPYSSSLLPQFSAGIIVSDTSGIRTYAEPDTGGAERAYFFDDENNRLIVEDDGVEHVLLEGVTTFRVSFEPMQSKTSIKTGGVYDRTRRATVTFTITSGAQTDDFTEFHGEQTVSLSSSVVPRRNVW